MNWIQSQAFLFQVLMSLKFNWNQSFKIISHLRFPFGSFQNRWSRQRGGAWKTWKKRTKNIRAAVSIQFLVLNQDYLLYYNGQKILTKILFTWLGSILYLFFLANKVANETLIEKPITAITMASLRMSGQNVNFAILGTGSPVGISLTIAILYFLLNSKKYEATVANITWRIYKKFV